MPHTSRILVVATVSAFLSPFMVSSVNIAVPTIGREMAVGAARLGWVMSTYLLAVGMLLLPAGRLGDLKGRKTIFMAGVGIFVVASLVCATAVSWTMLLVGRALQGMGAGLYLSTGVALLTATYPVADRGRVLGINVAAVYAGLSVGPVTGGFLTERVGWRSIFVVGAVLATAILLLGWQALKKRVRDTPARPDFLGSLTYMTSLGAIAYALQDLPSARSLALVAAGCAGMCYFARFERTVANPLINLRALTENKMFLFSTLTAFLHYSATFGSLFILSLYLQSVRGLTAESAGALLLLQPIVQMVSSPIAGRISDRVAPDRLVTAGMILTVGALVALSFINSTTSFALVGFALVINGAAFGLFASPNANAIMSSVEKDDYGTASGALATVRVIGQLVSMSIVMTFLGGVHRSELPGVSLSMADFVSDSRQAFIALASVAATAAVVSAMRESLRRPA